MYVSTLTLTLPPARVYIACPPDRLNPCPSPQPLVGPRQCSRCLDGGSGSCFPPGYHPTSEHCLPMPRLGWGEGAHREFDGGHQWVAQRLHHLLRRLHHHHAALDGQPVRCRAEVAVQQRAAVGRDNSGEDEGRAELTERQERERVERRERERARGEEQREGVEDWKICRKPQSERRTCSGG